MLLMINPLAFLGLLLEAAIDEVFDWIRGPIPTIPEFGFQCLACGHDVTQTEELNCPSCGDAAALDQEIYKNEMRILAAKVPVKLQEEFSLSGAYQAEYVRRQRILEDANRKRLVGELGVAVSDLRPAGTVEIDEQSYSATAESSLVKVTTPVIVVGVKGSVLCVREAEV